MPSVGDRVAQTVVAGVIEAGAEPVFHPGSYGYRPGRSALDAVAVSRRRCWEADWVIDLDIRKFFDEIDHTALMDRLRARMKDKRVCALVKACLKSGVLTGLGRQGRDTDRNTPVLQSRFRAELLSAPVE